MVTALALHEAAHAVAAITYGLPIRRVSIRGTKHTGGHALLNVPIGGVDGHIVLVWRLVGAAAERRATGRPAVLDAHDREMARLQACCALNVEPDDPHVDAYLARYRVLADSFVLRHWDWIVRAAEQLERRQELDGSDIADLM